MGTRTLYMKHHETILLWLPLGTWGERNKIRTILTVNSWIINWELQRTNKVVGCEPFVLSCVISRFSQQSQPPIEFVDDTSPPSHFRRKKQDLSGHFRPDTNVCKSWYWTNRSTNKTSSKHFQQLRVPTGPSLLSTVHRGQGRPLLQGMREHFQHVLQQRKSCANVGGTWVFFWREKNPEMIDDDWRCVDFVVEMVLLNNSDETKICL